MKRFDPNYQAALDLLPEDGRSLRYISVEVSDPDSWPFVAHRPLTRGDDLPAALGDDLRARQRAQAAEALGAAVDGDDLRGYADPLMSGVVHAVNAVHGILDRLGVARRRGRLGGTSGRTAKAAPARSRCSTGGRCGTSPRSSSPASPGTASATRCTSTTSWSSSSSRRRT